MKASEAFMKVAEWATVHGAAPLNAHPGLWSRALPWNGHEATVYLNGHREPLTTPDGASVPAFHALVFVEGWPAVLMSPYGGTVVGLTTEDDLIGALEADMRVPA